MADKGYQWWIIVFFLTGLTALGVTTVVRVFDIDPGGKVEDPELIIEDEHWAAWMPIDNGFTHAATGYTYWNGVLIQVGDYWERTGGTVTFSAGFTTVVITGSAGSKSLTKNDFDWLNIVANRPGAYPPIDLDEIGLLWPDPGTETLCSGIDSCTQPYPDPDDPSTPLTPEAPCLCEPSDCDTDGLAMIPPECLRLRSIHSHFLPEAVITYWQGDSGYKLKARQDAHGGEHNRYRFFSNDPVQVAAYKDGAPVEVNVGVVRKITIYGMEIIDHGEVHDPGLDGGQVGAPLPL